MQLSIIVVFMCKLLAMLTLHVTGYLPLSYNNIIYHNGLVYGLLSVADWVLVSLKYIFSL